MIILKILLVDSHPDDGESAAGGTVARFVREGHEVKSIYFVPCTEDSRNIGHIEDHSKVSEMLGVKEVIPYDFRRDGYIENHKQEIREILWKLRELWKPDIVLCPSIHDFHQDHRAIAECCFTIFRDTSTILSYEVLRSSTPEFKPNYFVILQLCDVTKKLDALDLYKSQKIARPYASERERYSAHLKMRGTQAKVDWAEAFEIVWGRLD